MAELAVSGIILGSIIALGAIGVSLIYGILRFAHFAHGDMMTFGAYVAFFFVHSVFSSLGGERFRLGPLTFGPSLIIGIFGAMAISALVALLIDRIIYRPLRQRRAGLVMLAMSSLGAAIILRSIIYLVWGPQSQAYSRIIQPALFLPLGIRIKPDELFIVGVALLLVIGLYMFLQRTKLGKAMRATADNVDLARISGINTDRVVAYTWVLGASLASTAGVLLGLESQLMPEMGWGFLLPLFAATILGGIGSPFGAFVGAMVVGIVQQTSTYYMSPAYKPAVAFLILILILLVRPTGIFGRRTPWI